MKQMAADINMVRPKLITIPLNPGTDPPEPIHVNPDDIPPELYLSQGGGIAYFFDIKSAFGSVCRSRAFDDLRRKFPGEIYLEKLFKL